VPVTVFYLILRGLDTIEDDMTIDIKEKEPLLREFHKNMMVDGWSYDGCAPGEKDRDLLVYFDCVVQEFKKVPSKYADIITDITIKMGNGMADYALNAEFNTTGVDSIKDYEKYCHYVAGLVGEGVTRLFVTAELANPRLMEKPELTESMGQFLQKTNIIRDIREDWDLGRRWWPREIWSQYFDKFEDLLEPANRQRAVWCLNHMVLNALKHVEDCIFYMAGVKEQSVFNFVAIPQTMAIATLELVFGNPKVFDQNVKITRGEACQIMIDSTQNLFIVCEVFRKFARRIHQKADPRDPNYLAISIRCGKIEQFIESIYPRQTAEKAQEKYDLKARGDPGMDIGDAAMLVVVILMAMAFMALVMVSVDRCSPVSVQISPAPCAIGRCQRVRPSTSVGGQGGPTAPTLSRPEIFKIFNQEAN
jgi:farnesyl-diphosphate farnesyltransferase